MANHVKGSTMSRVLLTLVSIAALAIAVEFLGAGERNQGSSARASEQKSESPIPMILQQTDGDRLVHRAGPLRGVPFTIKVDGQFGNSEDFFVFASVLAPGKTIPFHKHHNAEELVIFEEAGAEVI